MQGLGMEFTACKGEMMVSRTTSLP